jgi:general secretion pathway protein D
LRTAEIKQAIARLDIAAEGGGRIHVYYLKHADADELATTLSALLSGQPPPGTAGGVVSGGAPGAAALRAAVTELSGGEISVTPDPPTNSLVIQSSVEGFNTLKQVIDQLDIPRPQVLVEALIMEVDISDGTDLGFSGLVRIFDSENSNFAIGTLSDSDLGAGDLPGASTLPAVTPGMLETLLKAAAAGSGVPPFVAGGNFVAGETLIQGLIRASASDSGTNVLSAPHILTLDNEEAEIKVGSNIPIVTSRVESASGQVDNLASSVNVERLDVGITLRVTPQISEGDSLRLKIFQEITGVTNSQFGAAEALQFGPSLTNRKVENSVVVADNETVVIGGLIDETNIEKTTKVPFLGDIPFLGWLFKSTSDSVVKTNLLVFLTPHIIRGDAELARETIRKREEFWQSSEGSLQLSRAERKEADRLAAEATAQGMPVTDYSGGNPVRKGLAAHRERYPVESLAALDVKAQDELAQTRHASAEATQRYGVLAATFGDEGAAAATLRQLIDAGYDGTLNAEERSGALLYEIHLGPYETQADAENAAAAIASGYGLAPKVTVERSPAP